MVFFKRKMRPGKYFTDPATVRMLKSVIRDDPEGVARAVAQGGNPNAIGRDEITPLAFCLFYPEKIRGIEALLDAGGDPNYEDPSPDGPPSVLRLAVQGGGAMAAMFKLLIEKGGDPNFRAGRMSGLKSALMSERFDTLFWLLDSGADPDSRDAFGATVLHTALGLAQWEVARELLRRGASAQATENDGECIARAFEERWPGEAFFDEFPEERAIGEELRAALIAAGAVFPAPTPEEVRAQWDEQGWCPYPPSLRTHLN